MLTDAHIIEFQKKGYTILTNALEEQEIKLLHQEADTLANYLMSEGYDLITDFGCVIEPWACGYLDEPETNDYKIDVNKYSTIRDTIYWPNTCTTTASKIILHKYGSTWASQLLYQKEVYLLNEQFIIKPPIGSSSSSSSFAWHKDSDYYQDNQLSKIHTIACWTALDSVNGENGSIEIQDFLGTRVKICAEPGTIIFMSNQLLHKSTSNQSTKFRRVFMPQFSSLPMYSSRTKKYVGFAIRCTSLFQNSSLDRTK